MQLTERQQKVWEFVKEKHGDQKRKYTFEPYVTHCWAVAELVFPYEDECVVTASLCHDILEDTDCTGDELIKALISAGYPEFHAKTLITNYVFDCTDIFTSERYPRRNRAERKKSEAERLSTITRQAQSIKYADFIDNISSIAQHDPGFAETYIQEKIRILDGMRAGNINLLIGACAALSEAEKTIRYAKENS